MCVHTTIVCVREFSKNADVFAHTYPFSGVSMFLLGTLRIICAVFFSMTSMMDGCSLQASVVENDGGNVSICKIGK